jgi:MraZ protein
MFRGASTVNLDAKGRFRFPSKYRNALEERCASEMVLTVNPGIPTREPCLWLFPRDEWETAERKVAELPSSDSIAQSLKRLFIGHATDCELDSAGRIRISALLREFADLEKRVVLIGQRNKFEIWDESLWKSKCDEWLKMNPEDRQLPIELESLSL